MARASRVAGISLLLLCLASQTWTAEGSRVAWWWWGANQSHEDPPASSTSSPTTTGVGTTTMDTTTVGTTTTRDEDPRDGHYMAIDVECFANGYGHNDRGVAHVALVRSNGSVALDVYVNPQGPVVSYLTPLTGITKELLDTEGMCVSEAMAMVRSLLPPEAIIIGQDVHHEIYWLGLREKIDYVQAIDVGVLWQAWDPQSRSFTIFSQAHMAKVLLGEDPDSPHSAAIDAVRSMRLFRLYQETFRQGELALDAARQRLLTASPTMSFSKHHPLVDNVCMGNRQMCFCGEPFISS